MAQERVEITGFSPVSPDVLWTVCGDFARPWHPLVVAMELQRDEHMATVRAFKVVDDAGFYRERLIYRSDSDRTLQYEHLKGIAGVVSYRARLAIIPVADGGSRIEWIAEIEAETERAREIAHGTAAIFQAGIDFLAEPTNTHLQPAGAFPDKSVAEPSPHQLHTLRIGGQPELAVTANTTAGNTLVLFLHGIGGGRDNWTDQLQRLTGRWTAAALDLRGYGDSRLGESQTTVDDYCNDILRVMDRFGARRLVLCGLSYGSWLATSFAMRHPGKLAGLVLSGGCTGMSEASDAEREGFLQSRQAPLDAGKAPVDFADAVVSVLAGPHASDETRSALRRSMAAIPAATYRDALNCFTHPPEKFDFSRLGMPVLMMTGEYDRLASPAEIRGVAQRIVEQAQAPSVRFEVIADAGHVCNIEQPDAYTNVLIEFLEGLTP